MTDEKDSSLNEEENKEAVKTADATVAASADKAAGKAAAKDAKKPVKKSDKPSFWARVKAFFKSYKGELKRITWPTPKQTFKNTGNVLLAMVIMGVFVCLLDLALSQLVSLLLKIGA